MQIQLMAPPQRQNTAKLDTVYVVIEANNTQKREKKKEILDINRLTDT